MVPKTKTKEKRKRITFKIRVPVHNLVAPRVLSTPYQDRTHNNKSIQNKMGNVPFHHKQTQDERLMD